MSALFISIAVFIMIGGLVSLVIMNSQAERRKHVMSVVRRENAVAVTKSKDTKNLVQRKSDLEKKLKETDAVKPKSKGLTLPQMISQAGFSTPIHKFWIYSAIFCIIMTVLFKLLGMSPFVLVMIAITSFLGLPRMYLKRKAAKRQKMFMDDFADALEAMMRLLKAGMPVTEAIRMVAKEFDGPMGEEMGIIFDQQKIGTPLPEAVLLASKRMPLAEMQMFATAIAIQTQTGSSLSEVLQNLANVIRSRYRLKRKVLALAAEAKASAMIVGSLPVIVAGGMFIINREYIEILYTTSQGKFLLGLSLVWMLIGSLVMRQMINFKV